MVVNGTKEFLGSNSAKSSAAIKSALQRKVNASITTKAKQFERTVEVDLNTKGS